MKRSISTVALVAMMVTAANHCPAQYRWPKTIAGLHGVLVDIWKPQILAYDRNVLHLKSVIAVSDIEKMKPVFGMMWMTARVRLDSVDGRIEFQTIRIDYVTMPEDSDRRDLAVVERDLSANIGALKTLPVADLAAFNKATPETTVVEGLADSTGLQTIDSLEDAALNAQVPQIVRVKPSARTEVIYTGAPNFEGIPGTRLEYATNSTPIVLQDGPGTYYTLDNGVWFVSWSPIGHWRAAISRPDDVSLIPRDHPAYSAQLVGVYRVNGFLYDGYLAGYTAFRVDTRNRYYHQNSFAGKVAGIAKRDRRRQSRKYHPPIPAEDYRTGAFFDKPVDSFHGFYETFEATHPAGWPYIQAY